MDQLALFEVIRGWLASDDLTTSDFDDVALLTNLLPTVRAIFLKADFDGPNPDLTSQIKSKALNICVNMAMASEDVIKEILQPKYALLLTVSQFLEIHDNYDLSVDTENSLWFLGNVSAESAEICQRLVTESNML